MSHESQNAIHSQIQPGSVHPTHVEAISGSHLYVSLSELILDKLFYHPAVNTDDEELSDTERDALHAIVGQVEPGVHLVESLVSEIEAAIQPAHQAIRVALSDADSRSYFALIGGHTSEKEEHNPLMGTRGVSRFASSCYSPAFVLECEVIKRLRKNGHDIQIVVPFVRALSDAAKIIDLLAEQGLPRGLEGLKVLYSVNVPSAALLSERLLHYFDGLVIDVDSLTEFTFGVDKTNQGLTPLFDPENEAVLTLIDTAVHAASSSSKPVLLLIQALAEYPKLQDYIVEHQGIDVAVTA